MCSLILFGKDICKHYDILADISKDLIWLHLAIHLAKCSGAAKPRELARSCSSKGRAWRLSGCVEEAGEKASEQAGAEAEKGKGPADIKS